MESNSLQDTIASTQPLSVSATGNATKQDTKKYRKESIPVALKNLVWNTFIGVQHGHWLCFFCHKELISRQTFRVGHIKSQAYGGATSIENLRPFCVACNEGMGTEHAEQYAKKYGFPFKANSRPRMGTSYVENMITNLTMLHQLVDPMENLDQALASLSLVENKQEAATSNTTTASLSKDVPMTEPIAAPSNAPLSVIDSAKELVFLKPVRQKCRAAIRGEKSKRCSRTACDNVHQLCKQHLQMFSQKQQKKD